MDINNEVAGGYIRSVPKIVPNKTALLVIDMINDYVHPDGAYGKQGIFNPEVYKLVPNIVKLIEKCIGQRIPIIYTTHVLNTGKDGTVVGGGIITEARPFLRYEGLRRQTWGTQVIDELPTADYIIEKPRLSAFYMTSLDVLLRDLCVETILISGIQTNYCIDGTARDAWNRDISFGLVTDCMTCFDKKLHVATIENLSSLGWASSLEEVMKNLEV